MAITVFPRVDVTGANRWPRLRRGHWSTRGLVLCLPFGQGAAASLHPATRIWANSGAAASPHGIYFDGSADYVELPGTVAQAILPTDRATVLVVRQCADTTLRLAALFGSTAITNSHRLNAFAPYSDGVVYWDFGGNSGANRLSVSRAKTTEVEAWAFVAGARGSSIWRNGVRLANQTTALTRANGASQFRINNGGGQNGDIQQTFFFAMLDAEWTGAEIAEWTANPWLMFESSGPSISALGVGGGGGGSSARAWTWVL